MPLQEKTAWRLRAEGYCSLALPPHRARAAFLAIIFRFLGLNAFARAFPPFFAAFVLTFEMPAAGTVAESFGAWPVSMSTMSLARWAKSAGRLGLAMPGA